MSVSLVKPAPRNRAHFRTRYRDFADMWNLPTLQLNDYRLTPSVPDFRGDPLVVRQRNDMHIHHKRLRNYRLI